MLAAGGFDLAAIDHTMPGKDGLAMLREIVALPQHPPVVFVTGTDNPQIAIEALTSGAIDFVIKTIGNEFLDLLAGRLRQALERVALEQAKLAAEAELRNANERLELLVREVHHRVSNSLQMVASFVSMQANQTRDAAACEALADTQSRIQAVGKVHQNLYTTSDLTRVDLDEYLRTLLGELETSFQQNQGRIEFDINAEPIDVSPDHAVSIGVIVNELVSNAAKYAFESADCGRIEIVLTRQGEAGYSLTISDDGRGFEPGSGPQGTGVGMRIVNAMTRSLQSDLERIPCPRGTCYRLVVPGDVNR